VAGEQNLLDPRRNDRSVDCAFVRPGSGWVICTVVVPHRQAHRGPLVPESNDVHPVSALLP